MPAKAKGRLPLTTFRFPPELLEQLDSLTEYLGLPSRSAAVQYAITKTVRAEIPGDFSPSGVQSVVSPKSTRTSGASKKSRKSA